MEILSLFIELLPRAVEFFKGKINQEKNLETIFQESVASVPNAEGCVKKLSRHFPTIVRREQNPNQLAKKIFEITEDEEIELETASEDRVNDYLRGIEKQYGLKSGRLGDDKDAIEMVSLILPLKDFSENFQTSVSSITIDSLRSELKEIRAEKSSLEELYRLWIFKVTKSLIDLTNDNLLPFFGYLIGKDLTKVEKISPDKVDDLERLKTRSDIIYALRDFLNPKISKGEIDNRVEKIRKKYKKKSEVVVSGLFSFRKLIFYSYYMLILVLLIENKELIETKTEKNLLKNILVNTDTGKKSEHS